MTIYYTKDGQRQPVTLARDDEGKLIKNKRGKFRVILSDGRRAWALKHFLEEETDDR